MTQTVERLLSRLLPAVCGLLRIRLLGIRGVRIIAAGRLAAGATAGATAGGRTSRLASCLTPALALLSLPAISRKLLLHLPLELLRLALQHFLLPFLLGSLLAVALLLG